MNSRKKLMSALVSTLLLVQTLGEPSILFAATNLTTNLSTETPTNEPIQPQVNPSLEEINDLLEKVAREEEIPSAILKAIAFQESSWRQFNTEGQPLLSGTGAIGIMQISQKYETPENIIKLKTDIEFNIRRGAELLNEKWSFTPRIGDGDRNKLENWYFAIWAYNCWDGRNNPNETNGTSSSTEGSTSETSTQTTTQTSSPSPSQTSVENPTVPSPTTTLPVYQERILAAIADPPAWLVRYIPAVEITSVPASSLPEQGVPQKTVQWTTPLPFHLADLNAEPVVEVIPEWTRLQGIDRIDTALEQAQKGWPQGAASVILARADDFPDALAGVPLAARLEAPVLLTSSQELDPRVLAALEELHPQTIYLLGGEGALGTNITTTLQKQGWSDGNLVRISGESRYGTAASLALATAATSLPAITVEGEITLGTIPQGTSLQSVPAVAITTGENFPDALGIASIAGAKKMPILLTSAKELPTETLETLRRLNPGKVYFIGGEGAVSAEVEQKVRESLNLSPSQIKRLWGASRYDTMAAVAQEFQGEIRNLSFATGEDFPDALAGAAFAAHQGSTIVLVPKSTFAQYSVLQNWVKGQLQILTTTSGNTESELPLKLYLLGGTGAISQEVEAELKSLSNQ